jgi:predicted nucleic acid-binding protein
MPIDVTNFHLINVTDTCAVWNVLSSLTLYRMAKQAKVSFCVTSFVYYECLLKKRSTKKPQDHNLQSRLRMCATQGDFTVQEVQLQDLLIPALMQQAGRIGKGEVSAIAFAYRTRQAVLTDDQKARRLASGPALAVVTQTTPQLLGWLIYSRHLLDGDYRTILGEHKEMEGPLEPHFKRAYLMAFRALCPVGQTDVSDESTESESSN